MPELLSPAGNREKLEAEYRELQEKISSGEIEVLTSSAMTAEELAKTEQIVNAEIFKGLGVSMTEMPIDEAKKLIRKGLTFSSIAEKLCFDSVAHFNETFKNNVGMTPGEYKQSIK